MDPVRIELLNLTTIGMCRVWLSFTEGFEGFDVKKCQFLFFAS